MTTFLDLMPKFTTPALCATEGSPDDWHPPSGGEGVQIGASAKVVCRRCPALDECRTYAMTHSVGGIWGGLTEKERGVMRRVVPGATRTRSHCSKGKHEMTPENVQRNGDRLQCRLCHNAADRASRARRAAS